jgi:prepilin-type N-terminal cleavage/methylation domain-containing protein
MKPAFHRAKGFALIEVVAGLVVLAVVVGIGTLFIENIVKGYCFAQSHAHLAQKGQIAIMRLVGDFCRIQSIDASSAANNITYTADFSSEGAAAVESHTVAVGVLDPATVLYDGDILIDRVNAFTLAYYAADGQTEVGPASARLVQVTLDCAGAGGTTTRFSTRVAVP